MNGEVGHGRRPGGPGELGRLESGLALVFGLLALAGAWWIQSDAPTGGRLGVFWLLLTSSAAIALVSNLMGRRPKAIGLALAFFVTAIVGSLAADLPEISSALGEGDSPLAVTIYAGFGLIAAAFFVLNPARLSAAELVVLALVLFAAGNGKVWTRSNEDFFPIYAGLAALAILSVPKAREVVGQSGLARLAFVLSAAFILWFLFCGMLGEDPGRTDELFSRLIAGAITGWAAAKVLTRDGVRRALTIAAISGAAVFVVLPALLEAAQVLEMGHVLRGTRLRLFSLHPNLTGTFLALELVLAAGLIVGATGWRRWLLIVISLATVPALYLTRSRTAWMAALVGLAVLFLARRVSRKVWFGLGSAAAALFLVVVFVAPVREAVLRPSTSDQSLSQRIYLWDASAKLVAENPVMGIGPNNYFAHARTAVSPSYYDNTDKGLHPHNLLLAVAEGSGLIGLALFLGLVAVVAGLAMRSLQNMQEKQASSTPLGGTVLASLAALLAANMFDLGLSQMTFVPTLFWLLGGMAIALESERKVVEAAQPRSSAIRCLSALVFLVVFAARPFAGERFFQSGVHLQDKSDPAAALAEWERASRLIPLSTAPLIRSAQVAATSDQPELSAEFFERAIGLIPTHPRFRYRYSLLLLRQAKPLQAIEQIERSLELDPHSDEEGLFRLHFADCLARAGRVAEARVQLKQSLLVMPDDTGRLASMGWKLSVKDGAPIRFKELAIELGATLATDVASRESWDIRRRGNHLGRMLREMGASKEALEMLNRLAEAGGGLDLSLQRLRLELQSDLGLAFQEENAFQAKQKQGALLDVHLKPRAKMLRAEEGLGSAIDMYFERGVFEQLFGELYQAAMKVGDLERQDRAITGLVYFADRNERVEHLLSHADFLAKSTRGEEALTFIRTAFLACDVLKHSASREQAALLLANTALMASKVRGRSVTEQLEAIEAIVGDDSSGVTSQLFWIVCYLNLSGSQPSLQSEALIRFETLRGQFPGEGESLLRYFDLASERGDSSSIDPGTGHDKK
ncbi:MAG: O-antigen ligase/tetratricopeptide (TPR) repeat protein [Planctomycetota bacterium]|jgi:O-antigen ligase/tetratricopeptide (TPR) repeat protein